ncbi:hypothetical protein [Halobacteriaceae bacterium SHR40]|uniref:hypothetical protein n=1 Tax=Halovenus amylolytica TaxID=2500550 RepID=UPI000FE43C5F
MSDETSDFELAELDYVRAAIPDGLRLESPILVRANEVQQTPLSDNAPVVKVSDRNQNPFDINIWDMHEVAVNWKVGHWYVVTEARGHVWKTESGDVKHRLTSTADFTVDWFGQDIDPAPVDNQFERLSDGSIEHNSGKKSGEIECDSEGQSIDTNSRDAEEILEETEEGSVTDEIINDFEL